MHSLRAQRLELIAGWRMALLGLLASLAALGGSVAIAHHGPAGGTGAGPAPAYVSHTSSLIGTADGSLIEGDGAVPIAPARSTAASATDWWLMGGAGLGLAGLACGLVRLLTFLNRRLV